MGRGLRTAILWRQIRRLFALAFALAVCIWKYWKAHLRGSMTLERRALWLQQACSDVLASLGITYKVEGQPPPYGLVVSNHLSYLDIVVISSAMPCFFVAKSEVDHWPIFGRAARGGGTLFLDRESRASADEVARKIVDRLKLPIPVLLFPEGRSSDGERVLPFHSRLIHPAIQIGAPITTAAVSYFVADESGGNLPERELCWYGDESFAAHLWKVLSLTRFCAKVQFGHSEIYCDRRVAALRTHEEVSKMRAGQTLALR